MARFSPEKIERFWRDQNPRRRALRKALNARRLPYGVAVWNISKEWNIGNLIRTANAFLCGEIILVGSEEFDESGGARIHRFERMRHFPDPAGLQRYAQEAGYTVVATEIDPQAEILHRFRFPEKPLFLFGSELAGLSPEMMKLAQHRIMIPQYGLTPCLNVNVSCSIVLYDYITRTFPDLEPVPMDGGKFKMDPGSGRRSG